jgi:uncharacterized protein (UPF0335 family)
MASEELAFEGQIKRLYAVLHSLGIDPKDWKKEHNIASYAKLTRAQCSEYIEDLEKLEAEKKGEVPAGGATIKDDAEAVKEEMKSQARENEQLLDQAHAQAEVARMAVVMKFCATEAQQIVEGMSNGGVTEGTKASMIQKFATTMFIESMRRGL